jgi:hypothetical protein
MKGEVMKFRNMMVATSAVLLIPAAALAAGGMRDGLWELTTTMDMPGMPMQIPPQVMQHCYSKDDVKDQKKVISRDKDCAIKEFKTSGSKVSWKMTCTGEREGTFSGETVFSGDSYVSNMKMNADGQNVNMKVLGKRIGNCK